MRQPLSRIYRRFLWQAYDNIGALIAINAIWFGIFAVPTVLCFRFTPLGPGLRLAATVVVGLLTYAVAASGVFAQVARIARREEPSVRGFFREGRPFYFRALGLSAIFTAAYLLLYHSIRFYGSLKVGHGVLGYFLAGIQIWILAFLLLMQVYLLPLLFLKGWGIRQVLKWSAMLVVLRPGFTALVFLQVFGLGVVLSVTGIGIVLLVYSFGALFLNIAVRQMLRSLEPPRKPVEGKRPTSWKEILGERAGAAGADGVGGRPGSEGRAVEDEEEKEDQRSLRDILRPWD
jgi:uncharacterized membrane protein YesL